jgi:hypothetical protein
MGVVVGACQHGRFVGHLDVERINEGDRAFLARVVAALVDRVAEQGAGGNGQARQDGVGEGLLGVFEGQFYFVQSQHG